MRPIGPEQNFIEVQHDWLGLEDKMQYFVAHPEEVELIATRSHGVFAEPYLTLAAVSCYVQRLIEGRSHF